MIRWSVHTNSGQYYIIYDLNHIIEESSRIIIDREAGYPLRQKSEPFTAFTLLNYHILTNQCFRFGCTFSVDKKCCRSSDLGKQINKQVGLVSTDGLGRSVN